MNPWLLNQNIVMPLQRMNERLAKDFVLWVWYSLKLFFAGFQNTCGKVIELRLCDNQATFLELIILFPMQCQYLESQKSAVRNVSTEETNILYIKITQAISYQLNQATQPQFDNSINSIQQYSKSNTYIQTRCQ